MVALESLRCCLDKLIVNLVCSGEERSISAAREIVQGYDGGKAKQMSIRGVSCLMFDSGKEIGFEEFCKKLECLGGKWNAYYIAYFGESAYSKGDFHICADENEIIFDTAVSLYKNLCKLTDKNGEQSIWGDGRGEYCEVLYMGCCAKNGIYKKETAVNILRMRYGNKGLDYDNLLKFSLLKEIDNVYPYLHYDFDDNAIVGELKSEAAGFFKYGIANGADKRKEEYDRIIAENKEADDFYSEYILKAESEREDFDKFISVCDFDYSDYPELAEYKNDFVIGKSGTMMTGYKEDDIIVHIVSESAIKDGILTLPEGISAFVPHFCSYVRTSDIREIALPSTFVGEIRLDSRFTFPNLKRIVVGNDNLISVLIQGKCDDMLLLKFKRELNFPIAMGV